MQGDLTTVDRAKAWVAPDQGVLTSQNNDMFARLVTAVSRLAMNYMGRDTLARTVRTESYRGGRTGVLVLRTWPVLAVGSLVVGAGQVALAQDLYTLEGVRPAGGTQRIVLGQGRTFYSPGPAGVSVTYTTGFVRTESLVVATDHTVSITGMWLQDEGVMHSGVPVVGYTVQDGVYTLPVELVGQTVSVTYSYVPEDIEQVVIQEVGMLVKSRQHIGEASKALPSGGGTMSYLPVKLSDLSQVMLGNYRRTVPS